jgi:hypothetical protein
MSNWVSGEEEGVARDPEKAEEKFGRKKLLKPLLLEKDFDRSWGVGL